MPSPVGFGSQDHPALWDYPVLWDWDLGAVNAQPYGIGIQGLSLPSPMGLGSGGCDCPALQDQEPGGGSI